MKKHVGIAISGGGHRATMWGLGPLLYLVDTGKNAEVGAISSVSGGSITNGVVAHEVDYPYVAPDAFDEAMRPMARNVADTGLFFWGPSTNAYVLSLFAVLALGAVTFVTGVVLLALDGLRLGSGLVLLAGAAIVAAGARYFEQRSEVLDKALAKTYFSTDGRPTALAAVKRGVDHVICSTELQSADHLYFTPGFLYSYAFGPGQPYDLRLSTAVQCSACLPGAFAVRRLKAQPYFAANPDRTDLALVDGGVYDNMADQWIDGLANRVKRVPTLPVVSPDLDELVVVNASAATAWTPMAKSKVVLLAELATLVRVNSVMYQVTTERRRSALVTQWQTTAATGKGMRGALVHIGQTPYTVADAFARSTDPAVAERARNVLALLGDDAASRKRWQDLADRCRHTPTVLRKLGRETTLDLMEESYVLAMCNLHVILGYPLPGLPGRERFERLLAEGPVTAGTATRVVDLRDGAPDRAPTSPPAR